MSQEWLERIATAVLVEEDRDLDELSVVFVDDERMHEMNLAYRGIDRTTDVLSFEAETDADGSVSGEIIIAVPTAARQALQEGHSTEREIAWLLAHGLLHVLGDSDDDEALLEEMKRKQRLILERAGV